MTSRPRRAPVMVIHDTAGREIWVSPCAPRAAMDAKSGNIVVYRPISDKDSQRSRREPDERWLMRAFHVVRG
eukprot:7389215-Prymnesium_polylepis.1